MARSRRVYEKLKHPSSITDPWEYVWVIRKRLWVVITCTVAAGVIMLITIMGGKPTYLGETQLLIAPEQERKGLREETHVAMTYQDRAYLETQYELLSSKPLAVDVVEKLHLDQEPEFKDETSSGWAIIWRAVLRLLPAGGEEGNMTPEQIRTARMNKLVDQFMKRLEIEPVEATRLVNISFWASDPVLAAKVANTIAERFIERDLENKVEATQNVLEWLRDQQTEFSERVRESEEKLQEYRREKDIVSLEERENIVHEKLAKINLDLIEAENERRKAQIAYEQLEELVEKGKAPEVHPDLANNPHMELLKTQYLELLKEEAESSNRWGAKHPKMIQLRSQLEVQKKKLEDQINLAIETVKKRYEAAVAREKALMAALDEQKSLERDLNEKAIHYKLLMHELESNKTLFEEVLRRSKEGMSGLQLRASNIHITAPAEVPTYPLSRHRLRNMMLAGVLGLSMGIGLVFFLEFMDNSVRTVEDIEEHLGGMPFLGWVPSVGGAQFSEVGRGKLVVLQKPESAVSENFRTIRTNLIFSTAEVNRRTILVTSAIAGEGKTTVVTNLGVALAQLGKRIVLLDSDMRRPLIHKIFGVSAKPGLSSFLAGQATFDEVLQKTDIDNLWFIPSGPIPPNQTELLDSGAMHELLQKLSEEFDMSLFDSPPASSVADPLILSRLVGGVVGVIKCGAASRWVIQRSFQQLADVNARILGVVLNDVNMKRNGYARSYYYRYYTSSYYRPKREDAAE